MVGDARRQAVDGHDAAGETLLAHPLEDGVDHGTAAALLLHSAEEDVLLPGPEGLFHIALVEKGEVEGAGVVHHLQLDQLQPLSDAGFPWVLRRHGGNADPALQGGVPDGVHLPPVLVVPGIIGQQVGGGGQAQLVQLFGPYLPHAGEFGKRSVRSHGHGGPSFPGA